MSEQIYQGSCHCGAVKYQVNLNLDSVLSCNCSICGRKGSLLSFPSASDFKLLSGESNLTDYQFGAKKIHHLFCKTCGVSSFSQGTKAIAINVRCLENMDITKLPVNHYDGKSL